VRWSLRPAPDQKPRHLLGIGDVDDVIAGVAAGIDTFDCATPTRLARHGTALVPDPEARWRLDLTKSRWRESREPIAEGCPCAACREHTRGYLHHLARTNELTGARLVTLHNLTFMKAVMDGIRESIRAGTFEEHAAAILRGDSPYAAPATS
jgi:queuine tRNA-ribosyltransferase